MGVIDILALSGLPSAITAFFFWLFKRQIDRQADERRELAEEQEQKAIERDKNREHLILMLMQSTRASIVLSEATARAVQRIPDAHCNGDMHTALAYAEKVQHKQKDFLLELGIHSIYE